MTHVLFLKGIDDRSQAGVLIDERGQVQLALSGGVNAETFLRARGVEGAGLLLAPVDRRPNLHLERPELLFNEISDADTHKASLRKAKQLRKIFPELRCINEPEAVEASTRDRVAQRLDGIDGLIVPRTLRFQPRSLQAVLSLWKASFETPAILRRAGSHGGMDTVLLRHLEDVEKLHALPLDGSDYTMTEFVDYRSDDGLYRKYRFAVIDGEPFVRHVIMSEDWNIHAANRAEMKQREDLLQEEVDRIESFERELKPQIGKRLREISERMGLDFFGIDCNVTPQGDMILFEANANMNILVNPAPAPNIWQPCIDRMLDALVHMIDTTTT
jgi:glutathione synthase/RimK-type ligase-like ATP-grasp enzyme